MSNASDVETVTPEQLQAQIQELKDAQATRDRKIQELETEKATLAARASVVQPPAAVAPASVGLTDAEINAQTKSILEGASTDPDKASKDLANLIKKVAKDTATVAAGEATANIQPALENDRFVQKTREENKDLLAISPAMEEIIAAEANSRVLALPLGQRNFQSFQREVGNVIKEKRESLKELLKKPDAAAPAVPAGAKGEDGTGAAPAGSQAPIKKADGADKTSPEGRTALAASKGL